MVSVGICKFSGLLISPPACLNSYNPEGRSWLYCTLLHAAVAASASARMPTARLVVPLARFGASGEGSGWTQHLFRTFAVADAKQAARPSVLRHRGRTTWSSGEDCLHVLQTVCHTRTYSSRIVINILESKAEVARNQYQMQPIVPNESFQLDILVLIKPP